MEYKLHLQALSKLMVILLILTGCRQEDNKPFKNIIAEESYVEYKKMAPSEKEEFKKSVWYFYMFLHDYFYISCNTEKLYETGTFNFQDFRLLTLYINKDSISKKYFFRFKNDSLTCVTIKGAVGVEWKNGWPIKISNMTDDFDTVAFKQRTKDYALLVQEKYKEGPLKEWLLENQPYK